MKRYRITALLLALLLALPFYAAGCGNGGAEPVPAPIEKPAETTDKPEETTDKPEETPEPEPEEPGEFTATSAGIVGGVIDDAYGMRGEQQAKGVPTRSLPLSFENVPEGTKCLAISIIDPDGGDWIHWLVFAPVEDLPENAGIDWAGRLSQGKNDFGSIGYGGPTPPSGTHEYVITVYALAEEVSLVDGFPLNEFLSQVGSAPLGQIVLTGTYASN